ncbi:transcription factor [Castilleja foliolosa]|uniref:Transcription factor n=1 Tax=Castilleja foliolosa TaxID=1961234 RepID=A0ABD3D5R2_9LAMI
MEINTHNNNHSVFQDKMQDYVQALEQERLKVLVFQRELPLCLQLVTQAIESCKQQLSGTITKTECNRQLSECSEQTSSDAPVLEEFIPIIKRAESHSDSDEEPESKKAKIDDEINVSDDTEGQNGNNDDKNVEKSDWLRSVQLWNQSPDPLSKEDDDSPKKLEVKKSGAFHPFKKDEIFSPAVENLVPPVSTSSTAGNNGGGKKKEEKDGQPRKDRRCWSPELHTRFLLALQQLGGSHLATPKQIRELMKVDGLTNDEVKSHLQKYRLHTRRPSPSNQNTTNPPQFVVVTGGLWMPPEYTAAMATTTTTSGGAASKGIYAPIASLPQPFRETSESRKKTQHKSSDFNDRDSRSECGVRSSSPATSSSTHTTSVY